MSYSGPRADDTSRKAIDIAIGILVGLRDCPPEDAFAELARVVYQTGIGISSIAAGLVALASGSSAADHAEAFNAWGELIRQGRPAARGRAVVHRRKARLVIIGPAAQIVIRSSTSVITGSEVPRRGYRLGGCQWRVSALAPRCGAPGRL